MPEPKTFVDTNVLIYLLKDDAGKADRVEDLLRTGGIISVQVLNEIANVSLRKCRMGWTETNNFLELVRSVCPVEPLTVETHDLARRIAERYQLAVYDAVIVSAALLAGCDTLYTEDMQNGQLVEKQLRICNPFE